MPIIEAKLQALGLTLPEPLQLHPGVVLPFPWVRVRGNRGYVSGHAAQNYDGSLAGRWERSASTCRSTGATLGALTALSILASLKRELGDLDRVTAWLRVFGMVNSAQGSISSRWSSTDSRIDPRALRCAAREPRALRGRHGRIAVRHPVEIEAEVEIDG
jgi:hypothetical protein